MEPDALISQLSIVARKVQTALNAKLQPLNLTSNNYYFILKIHQAKSLSQEQLYKRIYLNHSNVTRQLDQLIEQGYVVKTQSETDGRVRNVTLTDAGVALIPKIEAVIQAVNDQLLNDVPTEVSTALIDGLNRVDANFS